MFQNGVDALSKIVDAFLSKSSKFHLVISSNPRTATPEETFLSGDSWGYDMFCGWKQAWFSWGASIKLSEKGSVKQTKILLACGTNTY